jgi:hypothetical protein
MADAVNPANIPAGVAAVAGYVDGPRSQWPATAWGKFSVPALRVSVFAAADALGFDVADTGNASPTAVAVTVAQRQRQGLPSVLYLNRDYLTPMSDALRMKGLQWLPPGAWPHPGPYLWAADPTGASHLSVSWAPVQPVAVQDRFLGTYDLSTLADGWLPVVAATPGVPTVTTTTRIEDDMLYVLTAPSGAAYLLYAGRAVGLHDAATVQALVAAGARQVALSSTADLDAIVAAYT